jgi:hypothetical protein
LELGEALAKPLADSMAVQDAGKVLASDTERFGSLLEGNER